MPRRAAISRPRAMSRDPIASIRESSPRCMAGMTFSVPIRAVLKTPTRRCGPGSPPQPARPETGLEPSQAPHSGPAINRTTSDSVQAERSSSRRSETLQRHAAAVADETYPSQALAPTEHRSGPNRSTTEADVGRPGRSGRANRRQSSTPPDRTSGHERAIEAPVSRSRTRKPSRRGRRSRIAR